MAADTPSHQPPPVPHLERKAAFLLLLLLALVLGSALYVLYARGVFERTQRLVLIADDAEGVAVGMDMTFAGFPIGRVTRIELGDDGNARILIDVPRPDARWLRQSSIFTLERPLIGATRIRAYSGVLTDPPLPDGAQRTVLRGDTAAEIPRLIASVRELTDNLAALSRSDAALASSLAQLQTLTTRLNQDPHGLLGALMGNPADAQKLVHTIERTHTLLARADQLATRLTRLAANADHQLFGADPGPGAVNNTPDGQAATPQGGLVASTQATVEQLGALLAQARASLQKADTVLTQVQAIATNTQQATTDLDRLRSDVESTLRQVDGLVNDIQSRWPFQRDTHIPLP